MKVLSLTYEIIKAVLFLISMPFRFVYYAYVRYFTFHDNGGRWKKDPITVIMYNIIALLVFFMALLVISKYLVD